MANFGSRRGFADKLSLPLMILAFLMVIGFLYWLNITAESTEVVIVEEEVGRVSSASAILDVNDFLNDVAQYEGKIVEVTGANVTSLLGPQAFWIGLENRSPFLVKMADDLVAEGMVVQSGQTVSLVGTVLSMSDSTHAAWDAQGAFPTEGDKVVAEFGKGSPYLEVSVVEGPGGADGAGGDAGSH